MVKLVRIMGKVIPPSVIGGFNGLGDDFNVAMGNNGPQWRGFGIWDRFERN